MKLFEDIDNGQDDLHDYDEDPLADVRLPEPKHGGHRLLTPVVITASIIALVIVFFAGYYAAFQLAENKYSDAAAELVTCRSMLETTHREVSVLKDSIDTLNHTITILSEDAGEREEGEITGTNGL